MFAVVLGSRRRRFAAFVQLMLFVFSASTSLLPCGAMDGDNVSMHHGMMMATPQDHGDAVAHHDHGASSTVAETSGNNTTQTSTAPATDTACPWVVGCAGFVQYTIDRSWRSVEQRVPSAAPVGDILRRVVTHRDIESPPPRI